MGFSSPRVLRQTNPLSSCLFIIATEFLSRRLDHLYSQYLSVQYHFVVPISICHLSFADYILIFSNGSQLSLHRLMDFLHHYEAVSGQLISQAKSSLCIGSLVCTLHLAIVHFLIGFQRALASIHIY